MGNQHVRFDSSPHCITPRNHQQKFPMYIWAGILGDYLLRVGTLDLSRYGFGSIQIRFLPEGYYICTSNRPRIVNAVLLKFGNIRRRVIFPRISL
ncbi:hypothetical protein TNIN_11551 [Trichonephila inaurata madagascariensis]|uniref:Uncharacterized protein n=1 Tax=Trichonephila inaurata madagascariensis TaxID=2747483 RepID=A0A8X6X509_9ARAC|nr:hypothetical protein TNIN_11551 [Trichonephila inaurata madagascariensis]